MMHCKKAFFYYYLLFLYYILCLFAVPENIVKCIDLEANAKMLPYCKKKKKILKDVEINNFRFVKSEVSGFIILQKDWIFFFFFHFVQNQYHTEIFMGRKN